MRVRPSGKANRDSPSLRGLLVDRRSASLLSGRHETRGSRSGGGSLPISRTGRATISDSYPKSHGQVSGSSIEIFLNLSSGRRFDGDHLGYGILSPISQPRVIRKAVEASALDDANDRGAVASWL